jgi:MscS family membrane protein
MIVLWRSRLSTDGDYSFNQYFLVLIGKIVKSVIIVVAVFTVLGSLGIDIRAALASVSVIGLALGLAAQDTVSNLFGAAAVFIDKPFRIGDSVRIGDVEGSVEEMGLRSTRIRNGEGHLITVPNREMGNSRIVNISRRPTFRTAFTLGLPHSMTAAEVQKAIDTTRETFAAHPQTHDVTVQFTRITDASLNLEVVHWCKTTEGRKQAAVLQELNLRLKERFDAEGIRLATPTRSIVMSSGGESGTPSVASTRPGTSTTR